MMQSTNLQLRVFLCHASADKPKVKELYRYLKRRGIKPWLDAIDLIPGQNWQVEIPKALNASDAIIICLTKHSLDREGYVQKEIKFALDRALEMPEGRIFLIPARLEDCEVPYSLKDYQWVDLFEENGYSKLMMAFKLRTSQLHRANIEVSSPHPVQTPELENSSIMQQEKSEPLSSGFEKPKPKIKKPLSKLNTQIVIALIGVLVTVSAILFSVLPWKDWLALPYVPTPSPEFTIKPVTTAIQPTIDLTSSISPIEISEEFGVKMNFVPRGAFQMGSDNGDPEEKPVHAVYLDNYYIDKFEVTNALYKLCVDRGVCSLPSVTVDYENSKYAEHPVVFVDWISALAYCEWRGARLPTEAEWEKAARGTDARTFPWGEGINDTFANYDGYVAGGKTTSVGQYESGKSIYGVYDLSGNVWEWVADWYDADYYSISPSSGPSGPREGDSRVVRGGAFDSSEELVRSFIRTWLSPTQTNSSVGFRCASDENP